MNCLIIDDESMSRKALEKLCKLDESLHVIASLDSALKAIPIINSKDIDLIFLDLHMPEFNGIDFLNSVNNLPQVIIVTADPNYALAAFEYSVIDYLLKPIETARFFKSILKAKNQANKKNIEPFQKGKDELFVKVDSRFVKIPTKDILWIEAKGDYALIKTKTKSFVVYTTMKKLLIKLPEDSFFKTHRSYIVNLTQIEDILENSVTIGVKPIPVSRYNKSALLEKLNII